MYNDIAIIVLCVFAVYGLYAAMHEISVLLATKKQNVIAICVPESFYEDSVNDAVAIAKRSVTADGFPEMLPIILCDSSNADVISKMGYDVYVKYTEVR